MFCVHALLITDIKIFLEKQREGNDSVCPTRRGNYNNSLYIQSRMYVGILRACVQRFVFYLLAVLRKIDIAWCGTWYVRTERITNDKI